MADTSAAGMVTVEVPAPVTNPASRAGHGNGHCGVRQRVDARRELDAEPVGNARRNRKSQVAAVIEGQSGELRARSRWRRPESLKPETFSATIS